LAGMTGLEKERGNGKESQGKKRTDNEEQKRKIRWRKAVGGIEKREEKLGNGNR
jgi:hypothetical protein